jgi:hypothetical protein
MTRAVPNHHGVMMLWSSGLQDHSYICQGGVKQGSNDTTVRTLYDKFIYIKLCEDSMPFHHTRSETRVLTILDVYW